MFATLLLLVINLAYIGLGIPDSLFGAAWPAMFSELAVPMSAGGIVTAVNAVCTFLSSLAAPRLIARYSTQAITIVSTALTALSLLLMSLSGQFLYLLFLCIPLGLGAGAIDTALNEYVATHYSAAQMNFLHCFYGIGVFTSPFLISFALSGKAGWRGGFVWVGLIQCALCIMLLFTLFLWRRAQTGETVPVRRKVLNVRQLFCVRGVPLMWVLFFLTCSVEFCCGTWAATYLFASVGAEQASAASIVTLYYLGIAAGRFVSGLLVRRLSPVHLVFLSGVGVTVGVVSLMFAQAENAVALSLFFIGACNGPVYPNLMHLTPRLFGEERASSLMGSFLAVSCLGILTMPPLFGTLVQAGAIRAFPCFLLVLCLLFCSVLLFGGARFLSRAQE